MTPAAQDRLHAEARNLRAMTQTQSSLLGGENTPLHETAGTGFSAVPQRDTISTPNPLATPLRTANGAPVRPGETPLRTPRDTLSLNEAYGGVDPEKLARQKLKSRLAGLPKPKNDYELVLPDEEEEQDATEEQQLSAEDAEERDRRLRLTREAEELAILNRRSQVLKRDLPRPKMVNPDRLYDEVERRTDQIQRMIAEEMARLILFDAARYPLPNAKPVSAPKDLEEYSAEEMASARAEVERELGEVVSEIDSEEWDEMDEMDVESIPSSTVEAKLKEAAPAGNKLEKKLSMTLGGYLNRQGLLSGKIKEVTDAIEQAMIDLEVYRLLQAREESAAPLRVSSIQEEVEKLERRERDGQRKYKELYELKQQLLREAAGVNGP